MLSQQSASLPSADHWRVDSWFYDLRSKVDYVQDEVTIHLESHEHEPVSNAISVSPVYVPTLSVDGDRHSKASSLVGDQSAVQGRSFGD